MGNLVGYPTYLQKLKSLQNQAIKHPIENSSTWWLVELFKFEVAKFVYGSLNNKTPNTFRKYSVKLMIAQVELQGSRLIVAI